MKEEQDYIKDIAEMRSMMERSSKFLSLSGLAGVMAGLYALAGAYVAYAIFHFDPALVNYGPLVPLSAADDLLKVILLAIVVLVLSIGTALFLSRKRAIKKREKFWNATAKRLLINMTVPLVVGGLLILVLIAKGLVGFIAPFTLLFYGLALYNASKFTYEEVKGLGLVQMGLGLIGCCFIEYGLLCWALGFGLVHIVYGIYLHYRYER